MTNNPQTFRKGDYIPVRLKDIEFLQGQDLPDDFYKESADLFARCGVWVKKDDFLARATAAGLKFIDPKTTPTPQEAS